MIYTDATNFTHLTLSLCINESVYNAIQNAGAPDPSAKTRAQQRELDSERDEPDAKKPKVARDTTIQQTTKVSAVCHSLFPRY